MGKRGPQSKFTDVACPNQSCAGAPRSKLTGYSTDNNTNTFYYNLRKDESTIDLALSISMKGMSNEAIGNVLEVQPVSVKRWLARATEQCDKEN